MQQIDRDHLEKICKAHGKDRARLEAQKKELESIERDLMKREVQNENERKKLYLKKKNVIYYTCLSYDNHVFTCQILNTSPSYFSNFKTDELCFSSSYLQNEMAIMEQNKADEKMMRKAEEQKA